MGYFQVIRTDGSSRRYSSMIRMLQNIDREDLETLWKLVKAKHGNTKPEETYERVLWGDLKVMLKPDVEGNPYGLSGSILINFGAGASGMSCVWEMLVGVGANSFIFEVPMIQNDREDVIMWHDREGVLRPFSVACTWDTIRLRADVLVVNQKLKTHDRLRQWDVGPDIDLNLIRCPLCKYVLSILSRIVLAATTYYLWNERNSRLFKKKVASEDQVVQVICHIVRLKLVSFKFKKVSARSRILIDRWKFPNLCISHDGSAGISWNDDDDDDVIDVLGLDSRETQATRHGFLAARMATSEPPAAWLGWA
ncbi:hypothetical protein Tco_0088811 [Tanacetum coccineum]